MRILEFWIQHNHASNAWPLRREWTTPQSVLSREKTNQWKYVAEPTDTWSLL